MINSGDTIALRLAYTYASLNTYWLSCTTTSCGYSTCPGTLITSSEWTSCSANMRFLIRAMNKMDGQPINSGDTVSIVSIAYGSEYRLRCDTSTSYKCRVISNAVDGTPLQYGDIVALKYPFGGRMRWLYYDSSYYYARDCSANTKSYCARHRYPMINSGDTIALRLAYTYASLNTYWLSCTTTSCGYSTCPGTLITSSEWTSCSANMRFLIRAMNKMDGQPINSGDTVSIVSISYGSEYRLRCGASTTYKCRVTS
ncbi:hypothetical protein P5673_024949 [Acropora cervicornis]|uniref:Uncharacterized protein n=1 Tax=Acropora cervicornis TaxID=6130 RepID=A0AAD9Q3I5_ACRCE|nr:hypothetical protein P5673_024949 [Acropora cervicornis]